MNSVKNHTTTLLFLLLVVPNVYGQDNATVTYTFEWTSVDYHKDYILIINGPLSKYEYHNEPHSHTSPQGYFVDFNHNYFDWYYDVVKKQITEQRVLKDGTRVIARWPAALSWEISEETKEIAGYTVQKAIAHGHYLRDENRPDWDYGEAIAWFTTDIPFTTGPQRFYGLPGLIVRLEFTDKSESYTLKNIEWDTGDTIVIPADGIEVSKGQTLQFNQLLNKKWLKQQKKALRGKGE